MVRRHPGTSGPSLREGGVGEGEFNQDLRADWSGVCGWGGVVDADDYHDVGYGAEGEVGCCLCRYGEWGFSPFRSGACLTLWGENEA